MKPLWIRILTHGVCLGLGLLLAVSLKRGDVSTQEHHSAGTEPKEWGMGDGSPARPGRPAAVKRDGNSGGMRPSSTAGGDFKGAWDAMRNMDLTIDQRLDMQISLLREWAMVDMEGAMRAALDNAWSGGREKGGVSPLMVAFDEAFQSRPADAWDLLQSGRLGLGTELFREQWIRSAVKTEPVFVFSVAEDIPFHLRMGAIQEAMRSAAGNEELKDQMIRKISELPDTPGSDNYIAIAFNALPANEGDAAEIRGRLVAATNPRARTLLLHQLTSTLREAGASTIRAEWDKLDPEMQKRAAVAFINGPQGSKNAPAVLDMLMATDQWDRVTAARAQLEDYSRSTSNTRELAEWGMKLPARPEAEALFRKTIDPLINRNNAEARQWIDALPASDPRRDKALFAYTENAIFARNDGELFQWGLERMQDAGIRAAAQRSYDGWARRRGLVSE